MSKRLLSEEQKERKRQTTKLWRERNKEHIKAYLQTNAERIKERDQKAAKLWREKNREHIKTYRQKNAVHAKEYKREYLLKNSEKEKERARLYRQKNFERFKEDRKIRNAAWRSENNERRSAYMKEWREKNEEKERQYYQEHKQEISKRHREYRLSNQEKYRTYFRNRRARIKLSGGKLSRGIDQRLMLLQRKRCACCKGNLKKTGYHLDHIIPVARQGPNEDSNMQLLCPGCNRTKHAKHPIDFMQSRGFLL